MRPIARIDRAAVADGVSQGAAEALSEVESDAMPVLLVLLVSVMADPSLLE